MTTHEIDANELKRMLDDDENVLVLDVREPDEYEDWHIPGAVNVPVNAVVRGAEVPVAEQQQIVTVCAHGARSEYARAALAKRGYLVRGLTGGMAAWNSVYDVVPVQQGGGDATVLQVRRVGKGCLSYMIVSDGEAAVIDPTIDVQTYVEQAKAHGARIVAALDTHAHADHASGGRELGGLVDATYYAPDEVGPVDRTVADGDRVTVGSATIHIVHTPGHTPGSVTYRLGELAFTGDTIFVESVGRPDLGQDVDRTAPVLWRTLHERVLNLPDGTRVLPGHYGESVELPRNEPLVAILGDLGSELKALALDEAGFAEWVRANAIPKPGNFEAIRAHNVGQAPIDDEDAIRDLEMGPNRCSVSD